MAWELSCRNRRLPVGTRFPALTPSGDLGQINETPRRWLIAEVAPDRPTGPGGERQSRGGFPQYRASPLPKTHSMAAGCRSNSGDLTKTMDCRPVLAV